MNLTKLTIENIMRIKAVEITPEGSTVRITGPNGNGKTSILSSICMLFCGKKLIPEKPVREGETTGKITAETSSGYIVTRHWTSPERSYLTLTNKDGAKFSNPQTILSGLVEDLSFDPLDFSQAQPKDRLETLKGLTGLDFSDIEDAKKKAFDTRTGVNRDTKNIAAQLDGYKDVPDEEIEVPSIEEVNKEIEKRKVHNGEIDQREGEIQEWKRKKERIDESIEIDKREIERHKKAIEQLEGRVSNNEIKSNEANEEIGHLKGQKDSLGPKYEIDDLNDELKKHYELKEKNQKITAKKRLQEKLNQSKNDAEKLTKKIEEQDALKRERIANADMPVEGMAIGESDVELNGIPFSQMSSSEQIRVSMAIAMAKNPELKIVLIKNGSLLDKAAMEQVSQFAEQMGFQVWVEEVADKKDQGAVFVHDGQLEE